MYYKDYSIDKYAKGGIFKDKLIGSSPNYDGILKLLKQFFYSPNIFLTEDEIGGSYYVINNAKGKIDNYYVFFSKGRYRFFEKDKMGYDDRMQEQRDKSEIISKQSKLKNKNFVDTMADFLLNNKIKGTPTTYGFNINRTPDYIERINEIEEKLKKLNIKYQLDFTNQWNVMFKLNKKDVLSENKTTDEEKEIETSIDIETIIKALQTSLKYAGANTRLKIEEQISALRIAQKYEKPGKMDNAKDRLAGNPEAKIVYDNLPRILSLSVEEIVNPYPKETYNDRLVDLALEIDKTMVNKTHRDWKGHQIKERVVKNLLSDFTKKDYYSTMELFELVKTIPKYLHQYDPNDADDYGKGGKFKEYKPKFSKKGYDYGKKAYHNGINAPFYDTEFNSFLKENVYPKKDNKLVNDYLDSWNKGWNDENYKNTDWLVK